MLTTHHHQATILDFTAEPYTPQRLRQALKDKDAVGMTVLTYTLRSAAKLITDIKTQHPDLPVIIGGPHCTLFPKQVLTDTQADISVQGDGEHTIIDIADALQYKKPLTTIAGIHFREQNTIKAGKPPHLIKDLDNLPIPSRTPIQHYHYGRAYNPHIKPNEFTSLITSRGCPYSCRFCSRHSISMSHYRIRSSENVLKELKKLKQQGYRYIQIADDSFLANTKQAHHLLESIIQEDLNLKIIVTGARVDNITSDLLLKMRQAGVYHLYFGLESGNQDVLDFYNKKTTLKQIRSAVIKSHQLGFFIVGSFILGAPFETEEHFNRTIAFAKALPLDAVSFMPLRYMAGSDLWEQAVDEGKLKETDYLVEVDKKYDLSSFSLDTIRSYCVKAHQQYYLRLSFILRLMKKSFHNDDLGFLQSYLSLMFANLHQSIRFFRQ